MGVDFGATEIAVAGLALGAASTAVSAIGAISSGQAQKSAADYQAQVAANNAIIANQQAKQAAAAGETATANEGLATRARVGAIKAAEAASNVDVNSGSAVDVQSSAKELGQLSALTVRSNYARQAYGYQTQSQSDLAQAEIDRATGQSAATAGLFSATGSLLSGASGAARQYSAWQLAGGGGGSSGISAGNSPYDVGATDNSINFGPV